MGILESHPLGAKSPARLRREAAVIDHGGVTEGLDSKFDCAPDPFLRVDQG